MQNQLIDKMGRHVGSVGISVKSRNPLAGWPAQDAKRLIESDIQFDVGRIAAQALSKNRKCLFGIVFHVQQSTAHAGVQNRNLGIEFASLGPVVKSLFSKAA